MKIKYFPIYWVRQYERGVVELFGKYRRFAEPGFHVQFPIFEITRVRDVREHTMDISPQNVITKDNVEINVDGIIWARPIYTEEEIKKTFYNIDNWKVAVMKLAQTNLRQEFGQLTLDESLIARGKIAQDLQIALDRIAEEWGITITKVEIKVIDPPADIKQAMHKQKTAEQDRRAMRLLATGRFEAAEQDKLALIQIAEGKREAKIKVAEGQAQAIKLVNEAARKYFVGNAKDLKRLEVVEESLKDNSKIVLTKEGITPNIILGELPVREREEEDEIELPKRKMQDEISRKYDLEI
ncbi:hypothetical protein PM10SUCC1_00950 [Propionigenium maris DSM 9537]|uniref:Band 7 domain-containing protein n=1 Tax=Propionigenium maris DSM 9537 TaxID=1123000 RepID=A0A9W6GI37_9FUSO|nr:SPFH domain-containing protein [Propionigenium maris]GLI54580.1 hypothetical protein PM10SUCC1_00950 [Propionigenium maris DSM 9537]